MSAIFKPKLVVTDLDGTFLNDEKDISEKNLKAVHALHEKGILFTICTGRPVTMMKAFAKLTKIQIPVIGANGGLIFDLQAEKPISHRCFEQSTLCELTKFSLKNNFDFCAYTENVVYHTKNSKRIKVFEAYNEYAKKKNCEGTVLKTIEDVQAFLEQKISKVLITEQSGSDLKKMSDFLKSIKGVFCAPSMTNVMDLTSEGVSKGSAVKILADYLGININEVCSFGDNTNDVSMLESTGFSVCMSNGTEDAKSVAKFVTQTTNNQHGFSDGVFAVCL